MNKRKSQEDPHPGLKRSRAPLIARVIGIYFFTVLVFIFLAVEFHVPLYEKNGGPTAWLGGIFFLYYFLPVPVAVLFGLAFRPFWKNVRNVLVSILLIQAAYSLVVYAQRYPYVQARWENIHETRQAHVNLRRFDPEEIDRDKNGLIDKIEVSLEFDSGNLPAGEYVARVLLSQGGERLPQAQVDFYKFRVPANVKKTISGRFDFYPIPYREYFEKGEIGMDLVFERILPVDEKAGRLLGFARWAPFFRSTLWDGRDPEIRVRTLQVETLSRVAVLSSSRVE